MGPSDCGMNALNQNKSSLPSGIPIRDWLTVMGKVTNKCPMGHLFQCYSTKGDKIECKEGLGTMAQWVKLLLCKYDEDFQSLKTHLHPGVVALVFNLSAPPVRWRQENAWELMGQLAALCNP